jgi:hypothetical protein
MQGARRARLRWPIFNRRATPQDGMDRFPNADVFLGQDTSGKQTQSCPSMQSPTRQSRYGDGAQIAGSLEAGGMSNGARSRLTGIAARPQWQPPRREGSVDCRREE